MSRLLRQGLVLILLAPPVAAAWARDYAIPEIEVAAEVRADGSVRITEARRYRFEGAWSWADYRLPADGFTGIRDIRVAEGERVYVNDDDGAPGTFRLLRDGGAVALRWFYRAQDEERVFTLSYVLDGAVVVGPRWSEFFWTYLGAGREKPTAALRIGLSLPEPVPPDSLQAWGRGALESAEVTRIAGRFYTEAAEIDRKQFAALRTVFPSSVFAGSVPLGDPAYSLERVLREELERLQAREAIRRRAEAAATFVPLVIVLGLAVFAFLCRRHRRRLRV